MLTRRNFLKGAAFTAGGIVTGASVVALGQRLLTAGDGVSRTAPLSHFNEEFTGDGAEWHVPDLSGGNNVNGPWASGDVNFNNLYAGQVHMEPESVIIRPCVPSPPFTVTAHCSSLDFINVDTHWGANMLSIGSADNIDTTGAKHYAIQWDIAFLGEIGIIDGTWEHYKLQSHQNHYIKLGDGTAFESPNWLRLVVHSGTDVDAYYSADGVNWTNYIIGYNPNINVEAVALWSYAATTRWDWVRFTPA